jgi:GTPase
MRDSNMRPRKLRDMFPVCRREESVPYKKHNKERILYITKSYNDCRVFPYTPQPMRWKLKRLYNTVGNMRKKFSNFLARFFKKKRTRIGIYGPPNAGKTTLANRIARDWTGDALGPVSEIPHETRRARKKEDIVITGANGNTVTMDIVDTPGVTTKIDYHEFLEFGMEKDEAIIRAREATEGVAEAMHWLREDISGVIYMLDSSLDPFMQVNIMMIGIIEARNLPVIIVANKIDLPDAAPGRIRSAFPQHPVVAISGLEGRNVEDLYETMLEYFG